jgi:hypothetical protein
MAALKELHRAEPANAEQARMMVLDIAANGFMAGTQVDMFGERDFSRSLFQERAKVLDHALRALRFTKEVFTAAVSGSSQLAAAGNRMNTAGNLECRAENERLIETLQRLATVRGPISDALSLAAQTVAHGRAARQAGVDFAAAARAIVAAGGEHATDARPVAAIGGGCLL